MRRRLLLGTLCLGVVVAVVGSASAIATTVGNPANRPAIQQHESVHTVLVPIRNVDGARTATVRIRTLAGGGNVVTINAWHLTPGFHAIHVHAVGVCDPGGAKPFASAGPHFNPSGASEAMQAGAFPVLLAGPDGTAWAEFVDDNFKLSDLFGQSGAAIVIHSAPDNYANIPNRYTSNGVAGPDADTLMTGDAGARVACGVVSPPAQSAT